MGLSTSPAHLVMLLSSLFSDKTRYHTCLCYMNDIAIYTNQWSEHLQQLELTLKTLRDARLSCNPRKTEIGLDETEYPGYRISSDSVRITKKRTEVIGKVTAP